MLFNSLPYLAFLGVVCSLFYGLPARLRLGWLVMANYFFYGWWNPIYLPLLLFYTLFNYSWGRWLARQSIHRKLSLWSGVIVNLIPLVYYKYGYFVTNVAQSEKSSSVALPLGISFITLQAIAYLVDVYRQKVKPAQLAPFVLYKSFFPQLLAGPIERPGELMPQFSFDKAYSPTLFWVGGKLMLWGYFKKVLIADKVALLVDPIFAHPQSYQPLLLLFASFLFSLQIYCDFSGYTDIARGTAFLFGIQLSLNFSRPYGSTNLIEFWQSWHITLHDWFKDYVYKPMLGQQPGQVRRVGAIIVVFLLSGLWHGANLTFLAWGLYHAGLYLLTYFGRHLPVSLPKVAQVVLTFSAVSLGWIFFRAPSLHEATYIISQLGHLRLLQLSDQGVQSLHEIIQYTTLSTLSLGILFGLLLVFLLVENTRLLYDFLRVESSRMIPTYRFILVDIVVLLLLLFGDWAGTSFIYYQF